MSEKMTAKKADQILRDGFHCSQCVMFHTAEDLGMDLKTALKMTGGLGGGCFQGDICGAVSAGICSLGLKYGFCEPGQAEQNDILVGKVNELKKRFLELHGSLQCKDLLGGLSFGVPEECEQIMAGGHDKTFKNCGQYCADVCAILDDIMKEDK